MEGSTMADPHQPRKTPPHASEHDVIEPPTSTSRPEILPPMELSSLLQFVPAPSASLSCHCPPIASHLPFPRPLHFPRRASLCLPSHVSMPRTNLGSHNGEEMGIPFPSVESIEAVLFDVDGTLCDSDPLHYQSFRDMLQEVGFQGGVPITEDFFINNISGNENFYIGTSLFPDWDQDKRDKFLCDKEARFRSLAAKHVNPVEGLDILCRWIEERGLRRAAVTNAPRENAECMISLLGLANFFELVVVGGECERAKPFPDPYQKALKHFELSPDQAFVLEDSSTGLRAAVAAGIPAVGVATRNPRDSLLEAGATFVVSNFKDSQLWKALGVQH